MSMMLAVVFCIIPCPWLVEDRVDSLEVNHYCDLCRN
jgi:hypothetical protein